MSHIKRKIDAVYDVTDLPLLGPGADPDPTYTPATARALARRIAVTDLRELLQMPTDTMIPGDMVDFLTDIMPEEGRYAYRVIDTDGYSVAGWADSIREYAAKLFAAGAYDDVHTYMLPWGFGDENNTAEKNVRASRCVMIDIDHVLVADDHVSIRSFLRTNLPAGIPAPSWVVHSGHGLHLYWPIDDVDMTDRTQSHYRSLIVHGLVTAMRGDERATDNVRAMRAPYSHNPKDPDAVVYTSLYHIADCCNRDIHRLDTALEYIPKSWRPKKSKRKSKSNPNPPDPTQTPAENAEKQSETGEKQAKTSQNQPKMTKIIDYIDPPDFTAKMIPWAEYHPHSRARNVLYDLHNFFVRHDGDICGYRHTWVMTWAWLTARCGHTVDEAIEAIEQYFPEDYPYYAEAVDIIRDVYGRMGAEWDRAPGLQLSKIAEALDFSENDYKCSYCGFSEERRAELRKRSNVAHKKRAKKARESQKAAALDDLLRDIADALRNGTWGAGVMQNLCEQYGISRSTLLARRRKNMDVILRYIEDPQDETPQDADITEIIIMPLPSPAPAETYYQYNEKEIDYMRDYDVYENWMLDRANSEQAAGDTIVPETATDDYDPWLDAALCDDNDGPIDYGDDQWGRLARAIMEDHDDPFDGIGDADDTAEYEDLPEYDDDLPEFDDSAYNTPVVTDNDTDVEKFYSEEVLLYGI